MSDTIEKQPKRVIKDNIKNSIKIIEIEEDINKKNFAIKDLCEIYTNDYYNCMKQFNDFRLCFNHYDNLIKCEITQEPLHSQ